MKLVLSKYAECLDWLVCRASDKCQREKRKTINGEDLIWAITTLGFDKYVEPLKLHLHKYREVDTFLIIKDAHCLVCA